MTAHVTVVVPVLDEERHLPLLLDQLRAQTYPTEHFEVIVADGGSTDATRSIVLGQAEVAGPAIRLVDNPDRVTAGGLNAGIAASRAPLVAILGGHAEIPADFLERSVQAIEANDADCAGGQIVTRGDGPTGEAIARALSSRFGVGSAAFRTGATQGRYADTVPFGIYRRDRLVEIGGFDLDLVGAEDDELNFRLTLAGGKIWYDPAITSVYYCRSSLLGLARQYFAYGRGKALVLRKHRSLPSARALVPPGLVIALVAASLFAIVGRRRPLAALAAGYTAGAVVAAVVATRDRPLLAPRAAAAYAVLHTSYGAGMLLGAVAPSGARP